ncbi:hypothetical protein, partial [Pseudomonas sp. HMWF011]|uniref:hypothetical protein n=1 Tax=Pseudomonas sp. HMWF011 TaxID=2056848 RepID=UPI0035325C54
ALFTRRRRTGEYRRAGRVARTWPASDAGLLATTEGNRRGAGCRGLAVYRGYRRDGRTRVYPPGGPQEGHDPGLGLQRVPQ